MSLSGVELYYFDGEQCSGGIARDIRIQLFCDPDAGGHPRLLFLVRHQTLTQSLSLPGVGKPLDYYVLEEDCHYSITWPSKYGCPVSSGGMFGSGIGGWLWFFVFGFAVYAALGCSYNIAYNRQHFGIEVAFPFSYACAAVRCAVLNPSLGRSQAMPHLEFWKELPGQSTMCPGVPSCVDLAEIGHAIADLGYVWTRAGNGRDYVFQGKAGGGDEPGQD
eukprot:3008507-Rhodomonas_salina.2